MGAGMTIKSLRILVQLDFPNETVRFVEGVSPHLDSEGNFWRPLTIAKGLDEIEAAINAEAWTLTLGLSGVNKTIADLAWKDTEEGQVIGSLVKILIQDMDEFDQPVGDPTVKFTGTIDDIIFDEAVSEDGIIADVTVEVVNRFTLRTLTSGAVLSDVDQQARSKVLNPTAEPDRFCERVPAFGDTKVVRWPVF
jgi:hypothetical protein